MSLAVSSITAYLTLFHRGRLKIVRPSLIAFTRDGGTNGRPKIVVHSMLYSTGPRGNVLVSFYAVLHHSGKKTVYPNWNHADGKPDSIVPGSGLFVGRDGISRYHHFLSLDRAAPLRFEPGNYRVELYVVATGEYTDRLLFSVDVRVPDHTNESTSLRFDWDPLTKVYQVEAKT